MLGDRARLVAKQPLCVREALGVSCSLRADIAKLKILVGSIPLLGTTIVESVKDCRFMTL